MTADQFIEKRFMYSFTGTYGHLRHIIIDKMFIGSFAMNSVLEDGRLGTITKAINNI